MAGMKLRAVFIGLIVGIVLVLRFYPCIAFKQGIIHLIKKGSSRVRGIVFLYGSHICTSCPNGTFLYSLRDREDIVFIVPGDYTGIDLKNLRSVFLLKGRVIKGNKSTVWLLKNVMRCRGLNIWQKHYFVELDSEQKFKSLKGF